MILLLAACTQEPTSTDSDTTQPEIHQVYAKAETANVPSNDDAADDPAIFVHPNDRNKSVVIATDKQYGLLVYDLHGAEIHRYPVGATNNVDLRQDCVIGKDTCTIVAASNRSFNGLSLFQLNPNTAELTAIGNDTLYSKSEEVYGCTMYKNATGQPFVFLIGKDGLIEQWALHGDSLNSLSASVVRTLQVPTQPEGGVVDDAKATLYVGEEAAGIWRFQAAPTASAEGKKVIAIEDFPALQADIEGIALYTTPQIQYLILSSQGSHTYAIFNTEQYDYLGSFRIPFGEDIDGAEETDGLEVTAKALGHAYPKGLLVVQDGFNDGTQNFKYIDWADVAAAFDPALAVEPQ